MMTMGADACVIDTNLLIYSTVSGSPWHQQARQWLEKLHDQDTRLCVTTQIVREYLVVLTRGNFFENTFSFNQILDQLESLLPTLVVLDEPVSAADLLRTLVRRYRVMGKQIHDANIVAVMLIHNVHRLATYNRTDFERFGEITLEEVPAPRKPDQELVP